MRLPWVGGRRAGRFRLRDALAMSRWGIEALDTLDQFLGECTPGIEDVEHRRASEAVDAARVHFEQLAALAGGRARPSELAVAKLITLGMVEMRRAVAAVDQQAAPTLALAAGQPNATEAALVRAILAEYKVRLDSQLPPDADTLAEAGREMPAPGDPRLSPQHLTATHLVGARHPAFGPAVELATAPTGAHATHAPGRLRPTTDPLDARYPRSALFRTGRWVMRYLWLFVVFGFALVGARLVSHAVPRSSQISDLQDLVESLMAERRLALSTTGLLLMMGVVVLMALLAVASSRARADRRREHAVLRLRARAAARATPSHDHAASPAAPIPSSAADPDAPRASAPAPTDAASEPPAAPSTPARDVPRSDQTTPASAAAWQRAPVSSRPSAVAESPAPAYTLSAPAEPVAAALSSAAAPLPDDAHPLSAASGGTQDASAQGRASFVPRVFISHSGDDDAAWGSRLVDDLRAALGGDPDSVWYDSRGVVVPEKGGIGGMQGGDYWQDQIVREIMGRNAFVALLSPEALDSGWVRVEIRLAWTRMNAKPTPGEAEPPAYVIVPVLVRPCKVPPPLNLIQYVSFLPGKAYEKALEEMVAAIRLGATRMLPPETEYGPPFDLSLMPQPDQFVGRQEDLEWLLRRLRTGGATAITALRGIGGIGKTALAAVAVHLAYGEGMFPDGIGVVLCQNRDDWAGVLRDVLTRFEPNRKQPEAADAAGLADAARPLLNGKRALVVLDNVEPGLDIARVVAPLKELGVTVLLTARQILPRAAVPAEGSHELDLLSTEEALDLFARQLGHDDAAQLGEVERAAAARIVKALDRHTLAVKLAGAYAADSSRDLDTLAGELERDPFDVPDGETPRAVALVLGRSVAALDDDARRLFLALPAFATNEFGREAVMALGRGLDVTDATASVNLLVLRALLDATKNEAMPGESDRERLRIHPLLHAYGGQERTALPRTALEQARLIVAQHYADYANATPDLALTPDEANILGALEWAHAHGQDELVAALCGGVQYFWRDTGRTAASLRYLPWGVAAAEAVAGMSDDREARLRAARLALTYGVALMNVGRLDDAQRTFEMNLTLRRDAEDRGGEGAALTYLGQVAQARGRLEEAEGYYQQALVIRREVQDRQGEGAVLGQLGQVAQLRGRLEEAEGYFQQSLAIMREVQDWTSEGATLTRLGQLAQDRGLLDEASVFYQRALLIAREVQNLQEQGVILGSLGLIAHTKRQWDDAESYFRQCLSILREVQDWPDEATVSLFLGELLIERRDNREEGCPLIRRAVSIRHELGLPDEEDARETARWLGCLDVDEPGA